MNVPGLRPDQIVTTARLAKALRFFLLSHGVTIPEDHQLAIGEGHLDTEERVLTIRYDFFQPVDVIPD
ncbi:MAG: hypothetical protein AB7V18_19370 [Pyrinomonadaceae bacterium]